MDITPILFQRLEKAKALTFKSLGFQKLPPLRSADGVVLEEKAPIPPLTMVVQRAMDDDKLSDKCWNSEMREVYLWENERYGGN